MTIIRASIKGFTLLSLSENMADFTLELIKPSLIVLGTNGSGKSSLVALLVGWPADKEFFANGGHYLITRESNGSIYTYGATFDPEPRYTFTCDGDELNPGGKIGIQKAMITSHFGITKDISDFITGELTFSNASPMMRKELFRRITNGDIDYAVGVYKKLIKASKDAVAVGKHLAKRYSYELSMVPTADDLAIKQQRVAVLERTIAKIMQDFSSPRPSSVTLAKIEALDTQLLSLSERVRQLRSRIPASTSLPYELNNIADLRSVTQYTLDELRTKLDTLSNDITRLDDELRFIPDSDVSLAAIKADITELEYKLLEQTAGINHTRTISDVDITTLRDELSDQQGLIYDICSLLPEDPELNYSDVAIHALRKEHVDCSIRLTSLNDEIAHLESHSKQIADTGNLVTCPGCATRFDPELVKYGVDPGTTITGKLELLYVARRELKATLAAVQADGERQVEVSTKRQQFRNTMAVNHRLAQALYVNNPNMINVNPHNIINTLSEVNNEIGIRESINRDNDKLAALKHTAESLETHGSNIQGMRASLESMRINAGVLSSSISDKVAFIELLDRILSGHTELDACTNELISLFGKREGMVNEYLDTQAQKMISDNLGRHAAELSAIQKQIAEIDSRKAAVASLEAEIAVNAREIAATDLMAVRLSPSTGLIARAMLGSITRVLDKVNDIINGIWSYPVQLGAPVPESDDSIELDYRFPVSFGGGNTSTDVLRTNAATREIVNLAFKIVFLESIGLTDLFVMDEFGTALDSKHRQSAYRRISDYLRTSCFKQHLIISHMPIAAEVFGEDVADVVVLHAENIEMPRGRAINTCVRNN